MSSSPKKTLELDLGLDFVSKKLLPNFLANAGVFQAAASGSAPAPASAPQSNSFPYKTEQTDLEHQSNF
jgi:hypothetical protein